VGAEFAGALATVEVTGGLTGFAELFAAAGVAAGRVGVAGLLFTPGAALGNPTVVPPALFVVCPVCCGGKLFSILTVTEFETPFGYVDDEVAPEDDAAGMDG